MRSKIARALMSIAIAIPVFILGINLISCGGGLRCTVEMVPLAFAGIFYGHAPIADVPDEISIWPFLIIGALALVIALIWEVGKGLEEYPRKPRTRNTGFRANGGFF